MSIYILGINTVYHELAACLLKDGELIAAVEEERFTRIKRGKKALVDNPDVIPINAINYCLQIAGITLQGIDYITLPFAPEARLKNMGIDQYFEEGSWGSEAGETLFYNKLMNVPKILQELNGGNLKAKIQWVPHHVSHASSAYFVSPFNESAILSIDGIGEMSSTWLGTGKGNEIQKIKEIQYPNSMGFVWEKMSAFLGFSEYDSAKVMGLSAYGNSDVYYSKFQELIRLLPDGTFVVNGDVFRFRINDFSPLEKHFGIRKINTPAERTEEHENIAAALQRITDDVVLHVATNLAKKTGQRNLCMAGGVSLNCVANSVLMASGLFDEIYIQPAANDAGTALGSAYYIWNQNLKNPKQFVMKHVYWGPEYSDQEIEEELKKHEITYKRKDDIATSTAEKIAAGSIIGWFQGRLEWGPRALGNRSLLADPRNSDMKRTLNERIKKREPFRPFAPSVLREDVPDWFVPIPNCASMSIEFMEINFEVIPAKRNIIPAVVHVDGTSRIQAVNKDTNPRYYALISAFKKLTGVPLLLNTSFNDNEPIVCSPSDAIQTFLRTKMDYLAIGNFLVSKKEG